MADYFVQFSEQLDELTDQEIFWFKENLKTPKMVIAAASTFDLESWPGFNWRLDEEERTLWFYTETGDSFYEDFLIQAFQEFLCKFRPNDIIKISMAHTCSKPRLGAFGGAWLHISINEVISGNTWDV